MNKIIPALIFFLFGTFFLNAQNTIEVEITNFESNKGYVLVALHNTEDSFLKEEFLGRKSEIKEDKVVVEFDDVPDGTYAISLFHDEDADGEMNTNFIGMPKENYGVSNNAPANFGPPKWKDAKFEVKNGETVKQEIELR
ncbi:DUF2141 domain-containing protein [Salegentibacter sp. F188]|uniref:DUF2141 domain-containing protein n=1 Tax=Autumnicola patrickiae TaxID=3075591 RepID=A0ABU3DZK3_9FLAO|nr:DUF2141 domain-containing protein [Salegentibacter sp. F188]MDT0689148.1 DUF2141 domain-containing protein [Salegentibacter sp. F188]